MDEVGYFGGTAFQWKRLPKGHILCHMTQTVSTKHTVYMFGIDNMS